MDSSPVEHRSLLGQVEDFGQSALHTAIESPINGAVQFIDHAANVHLPELDIIGAPTHDSVGAKAGALVGAAADLVGLSIATGGVADALGAGGIAAAAATGAIYGGLLTPSDAKSKNFLLDRAENGAIGAATFAAMGWCGQSAQRYRFVCRTRSPCPWQAASLLAQSQAPPVVQPLLKRRPY